MRKKKVIVVSLLGCVFLLLLGIYFLYEDKHPIADGLLSQKLKSEQFDKNIIENVAQYEELRSFLETNADTLIGVAEAVNVANFKESQREHQEGEAIVAYQKVYSFQLDYSSINV